MMRPFAGGVLILAVAAGRVLAGGDAFKTPGDLKQEAAIAEFTARMKTTNDPALFEEPIRVESRQIVAEQETKRAVLPEANSNALPESIPQLSVATNEWPELRPMEPANRPTGQAMKPAPRETPFAVASRKPFWVMVAVIVITVGTYLFNWWRSRANREE